MSIYEEQVHKIISSSVECESVILNHFASLLTYHWRENRSLIEIDESRERKRNIKSLFDFFLLENTNCYSKTNEKDCCITMP